MAGAPERWGTGWSADQLIGFRRGRVTPASPLDAHEPGAMIARRATGEGAMATMTSRGDVMRKAAEHVNARQFRADEESYRSDVRYHAPSLGVDVEGRDAMFAAVEQLVTATDARFEQRDVVELGPFAVSYTGVTGSVDGQRMAWDVLLVARFEGDEVAEVWSLRGSTPEPAG